MMLKLSDQHPETKEYILKHLDGFLEHPRDRALFEDLPDRSNTAPDAFLTASGGMVVAQGR